MYCLTRLKLIPFYMPQMVDLVLKKKTFDNIDNVDNVSAFHSHHAVTFLHVDIVL